jgi:hypothetical protein
MNQDVEELIGEVELAAQLQQQSGTLAAWRVGGRGPAYVKIGRKVFYKPSDISAWIARQRREPKTPAMRRSA